MVEKFIVSRDDSIYQAFPDVALTPTGKLLCVFLECTHHADRSYTNNMVVASTDRGRTWSPKQPLTPALRGDPKKGDPSYDCPRITTLSDGRLAAIINRAHENLLMFSEDEGETWSEMAPTAVEGGVPDKLIELKVGPDAGRWLLEAHVEQKGGWAVRNWFSDDQGKTWRGPRLIAQDPDLFLCEGSILECPGGQLVCFMRENSHMGYDCFKCISTDGGETWEGLYRMPVPGCHRPVAGMLRSGKVLITHRYCQGGKGWLGWWTQNFFAALTDVESCLARDRQRAQCRILPLDYDRSPVSDCGYSGWVQFPDGEVYVVNYCVDDAPKGHIRGYSLRESDLILA